MAAKAHARAAARTGRMGWGMGWVGKVDFTYFSLPYEHIFVRAYTSLFRSHLDPRLREHVTHIHTHTHTYVYKGASRNQLQFLRG